jgi:transposase
MKDIERLEKEIRDVEKEMHAIINRSKELAENYLLVVSVKGIGMINALAILIHTQNFTMFDNSRQFSCYAGMVPLDNSSGTTRKRGKHIRRIGTNKAIKALLTQAAKSAVVYDNELRTYYQ